MDAKPKSNKQKRLEKKRKQAMTVELAARVDPRAEAAARDAKAKRALKRAKERTQDLPRFLERLATADSDENAGEVSFMQLAEIFGAVHSLQSNQYPIPPVPQSFRDLFEVCWERTDLLRGRDYLRFANALLALSAHSVSWVKAPETWQPRSHNAYRQFDSLLRHLLAIYPVPTFMNSAWLEGLTAVGVVHQRWFIHVAQGANFRTAADLPIPLTRKQAHLYLQAPSDFDVLSAIRWAQLRDLGADERLIRSIVATRIGRSFEHEEFWITVLRWLVRHSIRDTSLYGPIIDYLHDQRYVSSAPNPKANLPDQPLLVPPHPNLSMKDREPIPLLKAIVAWHRRLGRYVEGPAIHWEPSPIVPFLHEEGEKSDRRIYTIKELTCSHDLQTEGRAMGHCVASYMQLCRSGLASIWSLRVVDGTGLEQRLLTIEVCGKQRQIVQARRRFNQWPSEKELSLLSRWTAKGGPTVSKWVKPAR